MIILEIPGNPIPWMRPGRRLMCGHIVVYDKQSKLKEQVKWIIRPKFGEPIASPVSLTFTFFMPIPKATSKKMREQMELNAIHHMKRPDVDNISKFYMDCLTGVALVDDSQVWNLSAQKRYSSNPRTVIEIDPQVLNIVHPKIEDDEEWW